MPDYGNSVKTGFPEFDENFKLYCEDEAEISKIITPDFVAKILEIAEKFKAINLSKLPKNSHPTYLLEHGVFLKLSIVRNSMYFAIYGYKFFDIKFNKNALKSKEEITQSLMYINILIDIAKVLNKK